MNITKFRNDGIREFPKVFVWGLIMFTVLISRIFPLKYRTEFELVSYTQRNKDKHKAK